ncbi:MAG: 50S ribosomal protein L23 [Candidatus Moranbacteria bacterium]|nr:50S ribosomal protein L23 [Candidatus Moranbacteria bacterium]
MATKKIKNKTDEAKETKVKSHPLIKSPRITEKSAINAEKGVYTFNVEDGANKNEIKKAINLLYGVKPVRISITKIADKSVIRRGIASVKRGGKKAVVHLKKGDKITFA